jgi:glycine/D-amino acid oxidase-like deaminating enzyme
VSGSGERFWGDELDIGEKAVIEQGRGSVELAPDLLVVGGGIMGVATALAVDTAGLGSVQLIEGSTLAAGATGGSAGLLQPEPHHGEDPDCLVELGRRSLDRWRQLEAATPGGVGLVDQGWIGLAPHPERFVSDPPPTAAWLDADQVGRLIPSLGTPVRGLLIERQARLNPQRAVARLARRLPRVATGVAATAVTIRGGKITAVASTAGTFTPGIVIFATGLPPRLDGLNPAVPADAIKGHLLVTEPTHIRLPGTIAPVAIPIEGGRLLVGGTLDIDDPTPNVRDEIITQLHAQLKTALPISAGLAVSHRWCCWRPHHPDGLPVIDLLPGLDNAWLTSGHYRTGVLMAPATADLLAEWVTTTKPPSAAAPFNATRLLSGPG